MQVITQISEPTIFDTDIPKICFIESLLSALNGFFKANSSSSMLANMETEFSPGSMPFYTDTYVDGDKLYVDAHIANKVFAKDDSEYTLMLSIKHEGHSKNTPDIQLVLVDENLARSQVNATAILEYTPINTPSLLMTIHHAIKDTGITFGTKSYCEKITQFLEKYTQVVEACH